MEKMINGNGLVRELKQLFPLKVYAKGRSLDELAENTGMQKVIQYIEKNYGSKAKS